MNINKIIVATVQVLVFVETNRNEIDNCITIPVFSDCFRRTSIRRLLSPKHKSDDMQQKQAYSVAITAPVQWKR